VLSAVVPPTEPDVGQGPRLGQERVETVTGYALFLKEDEKKGGDGYGRGGLAEVFGGCGIAESAEQGAFGDTRIDSFAESASLARTWPTNRTTSALV
jgi:hypothetical protein